MKKVTMKDIAKLAGTSQPVVSVVLGNSNGSTKVSQEKRELILKIADELHFVPNLAAKQLAGGKSHLIGVITSAYMSGMNAGLQSIVILELYARGYDVFCLPGPRIGNDGDAQEIMNNFRMRNVEGIISLAYPQRTRVISEKCGIPYVELGCDYAMPSFSDISFDLELGGEYAVEHLIRCHDRKNIVFLAGEPVSSGHGAAFSKFAGMRKAMNNAGLACPDSAFIDITACKVKDLMKRLKKDKVDGVFACNDFCAARFMREAAQYGLRIPQDLSVVGFDGNSFCDCLETPLATVQQPQGVLARQGIDLLFRKMDDAFDAAEHQPVRLPPVFLPGESCGCAGGKAEYLNADDTLYLNNLAGNNQKAPFTRFRNYWQKKEETK